MERKIAIVLTVFAIGYFTAIIFMSGGVSFELPINANGEEYNGIDYIVELQDGIVLQSSSTAIQYKEGCILDWCPTPYEPSVKAGEIVTSEDGTHCWIVTDFGSTFHYKLTECPENA